MTPFLSRQPRSSSRTSLVKAPGVLGIAPTCHTRSASCRFLALGVLACSTLAFSGLGCGALGCSEGTPLEVASESSIDRAVQARMGDLKHCWSAGDKRRSWMTGDVQTLHVSVQQTGNVKVTFKKSANNRHPVGSCMRTALDGLRFLPSDADVVVEISVRLGEPHKASAPASQAAGAAP